MVVGLNLQPRGVGLITDGGGKQKQEAKPEGVHARPWKGGRTLGMQTGSEHACSHGGGAAARQDDAETGLAHAGGGRESARPALEVRGGSLSREGRGHQKKEKDVQERRRTEEKKKKY